MHCPWTTWPAIGRTLKLPSLAVRSGLREPPEEMLRQVVCDRSYVIASRSFMISYEQQLEWRFVAVAIDGGTRVLASPTWQMSCLASKVYRNFRCLTHAIDSYRASRHADLAKIC